MQRHTGSILEEIRRIDVKRDKEHFIESKAENLIASAAHLIELINETYDSEIASDLNKRLLNAIRTQDFRKFQRGIRKVNESQIPRNRNVNDSKKN